MKALGFIISALSIAALAIVAACGSDDLPADAPGLANQSSVASTQHNFGAYARALTISLAVVAPRDDAGLHNLYVLSDQIISGSEPEGEAAFAELARRGVKVILSVDGKTPDIATAQKYGLRYVHSPIEYSGMDPVELARITKTFRELQGPFYVHCFHGRHRGPAAAAIGRIVVDGASRDQALAEMRQWCGTSGKYEGLYQTVGKSKIPDANETKQLDWDFPSQQVLDGFRAIMIGVPRAHDRLRELKVRAWVANPLHPDVDALNEAQKLRDLFAAGQALPETAHEADDFRNWLADSLGASRDLVELLRESSSKGLSSEQARQAEVALDRITSSCTACHAIYRD